MRPYAFLWVIIGPYRSLFVLTNFNGSLRVFIGIYAFLKVLMGPNGSFRSVCVLVDCNVFLCVLVNPYYLYG